MRVVGSVLLAMAVNAALIALTKAAFSDDRWDHATGHASFGAGIAVLLVASQMVWPNPRQGVERWLRRTLVMGLAMATIGSTMEAIGGFGDGPYDVNATTDRILDGAHNVGLVFTILGMLAMLVGLIGTLVIRIWFRVRGLRSAT